MIDVNTQTWALIGVVVVLLAVVGWLLYQRNESRRLQQRFGAEYKRAVSAAGDPGKAEADLRAREKRVAKLALVPLAPAVAARFGEAWSRLQGRFVDDPNGAVVDADELVRELMQARGYPMGDFESRAADISVDHPRVVENYRAAQAIATRASRNAAETEDLRRAVIHYRALFSELLEVKHAEPRSTTRQHEVRT